MPITTGMLLGMIKQLDKRIKTLEQREASVPEVRDNAGAIQ